MKLKAKSGFILFILSLLVATVIVISNVDAISPANEKMLPLPPTPGPSPTLAPYKPEGSEPIKNEQDVIRQILLIDSDWATRARPLTEEYITANPDKVIVEFYSTRQEAEAVYLGGGSPIQDIASEPVWVVRIKGDVLVQVVGGLRRDGKEESVNADGVTYIISQETGDLLAISGSAQTRSERMNSFENNE
jgi:hypothetical protein